MDRYNLEPLQLDLCGGHLCSHIYPEVLAGIRKSEPIKMHSPYLLLIGYKINVNFHKFHGQISGGRGKTIRPINFPLVSNPLELRIWDSLLPYSAIASRCVLLLATVYYRCFKKKK